MSINAGSMPSSLAKTYSKVSVFRVPNKSSMKKKKMPSMGKGMGARKEMKMSKGRKMKIMKNKGY